MAHHILVMGVSGSGKSVVAEALAEALGAKFLEADEFHPEENVTHMQAGLPLTDSMRQGWLDTIAATLSASTERCVLACSALKQVYRDRLSAQSGEHLVVHLVGDFSLIEERVSQRPQHFMPASLVGSQFADLEPPQGSNVVEIDVAQPLEVVVSRALSFIQSASSRED